MSLTQQKLEELRARLLTPDRKGGALLVIYPPEDELLFRAGYADILQELQANRIDVTVLDLRTQVFELLEQRRLLGKAFQADATGERDFYANLAGMVQRYIIELVRTAAEQSPQAILCCLHPAALYPWVSYSDLLEKIEIDVHNVLVLPFPGFEQGQALHFLNAKDGYNYRAARI